jgi:hypothetical protein
VSADAGVTVLRLWPRESECRACGVALIDPHKAIPVYEGDALPNDWSGEWAGFDACDACHAEQGKLAEPLALDELARRAASALLSRLRSRTWRGTTPVLVWDDEAGAFVERAGVRPPRDLGELVADLHEARRTFGPQALTVAVFRRRGRGLRGNETRELWAVMACGDRRRPTWVEAYVGTEGVGT